MKHIVCTSMIITTQLVVIQVFKLNCSRILIGLKRRLRDSAKSKLSQFLILFYTFIYCTKQLNDISSKMAYIKADSSNGTSTNLYFSWNNFKPKLKVSVKKILSHILISHNFMWISNASCTRVWSKFCYCC